MESLLTKTDQKEKKRRRREKKEEKSRLDKAMKIKKRQDSNATESINQQSIEITNRLREQFNEAMIREKPQSVSERPQAESEKLVSARFSSRLSSKL